VSFEKLPLSDAYHYILCLDENLQAAIYEFSNCAKRWLQKAPNVTKRHFAPFTPTGDLNDALFIIYRSPEGQIYERTYEPFNYSAPSKYFSVLPSDLGSTFNDEQANEYFMRLIRKTRPVNDMETEIEENEIVWESKSHHQTSDKFIIGDELKTAKDIRKLEKLDDPKRVWKKTRGAEKFIQQKIKNILEFRDLCKRSK
jgi:hypothetical protein